RFQRVFGKSSKASDDPDDLDGVEATNGSDARATSKAEASVERPAAEMAADPPNKVDTDEGPGSERQGELRGRGTRKDGKERARAVKRVVWFGMIGGAA